MTIEEADFKLTPAKGDGSPFWDLELLFTVKTKSGESKQEFRNAGYGLKLENALKQIANFRILCKYPKAALSIKNYIKVYKEEVNNLKSILQ